MIIVVQGEIFNLAFNTVLNTRFRKKQTKLLYQYIFNYMPVDAGQSAFSRCDSKETLVVQAEEWRIVAWKSLRCHILPPSSQASAVP